MIVDDLFEVFYGTDLELNTLKKTKVGINFVSRTEQNNGVSAIVEPLKNMAPFDAGLITVAAGGSVLSSFVQNKPFYSGRDILCLKPRKQMSLSEKLFYCMCIKSNHYKYSFGRQANRTLKFLKLPENIPEWVKNNKMPETNNISIAMIDKKMKLTERKWKIFTYMNLFNIVRGRGARMIDVKKNGKIPFVTAIDTNNGVTGKLNITPTHQGNVITVNRDGNGVGEAFYQPFPFCSTEAVHIFIPKFTINQFIAMFLVCLIRMERFKYNYGRKWSLERMNKTTISLPVNDKGEPDWKFMEEYIKSLPYSSNL